MSADPGQPFLAFTTVDLQRANFEWGLSCGPAALAACLGWSLERVRPLLGDFETRRHMNVTMMANAIRAADCTGIDSDPFFPTRGLVRIQFHGPWTEPGANPKWAYRHTHWVASKRQGDTLWVFDINSLWLPYGRWAAETIPLLTAEIPRADGKWTSTHLWEVRRAR